MSAHSTIGVNIYYAWQQNGERPTAGYKLLSEEITEMPEFDSAPEGIDVTPLSELVAIRRIAGLKDNGDDFGLTGNINDTDMTLWEGLVEQAKTSVAAGNYLELMVTVEGIAKAYFVSGTPCKLGFPGATVNSAFQGTYHFIPYQDHGWDTKGTITE